MKKISAQSIVEEMDNRSDLPDGWLGTSLEDLCIPPQYGWTTSAVGNGSGLKLLRTTDISSGKVDWPTVPCCEVEPDVPEKYLLREGDIVVSRAGSVGISYLVKDPPRAVFASYLIRFRPKPPVTSEFIGLFLNSPDYWTAIAEEATGIALPNVNASKLKALEVPLPPLQEQRRIVAKVEDLLARVTAARDRLAKVPKILKAFRQSVLAAACSGRLTEGWRDLHPKSDARELLKTILRERKKDTEPSEPERSYIDDVPDGWVLTSIDALTSRITSGSRDWKRYYREDGPGTFVMAQNVRPLQFDTSYRLAVAPPLHNRDRERSKVVMGDILVTIVGANTGDVCRVPTIVEEHYVCQSVALMRPVMLDISRFLELYLNSPAHGQAQYGDWIYGEGRPHLSFDHLRATAVMLPPLKEQQEIVRRVGALFKLADKIEERIAATTKRTDKLTQSILAKAFRGELVPTEAELARKEGRDYEPASVLLARIQSECETTAASPNATRRRQILTRKK